jgi:DNA-binding CsgD family transcriptional regulator
MHTLIAEPAAARAKALRALDILRPLGPSRALALCFSTLGSQDAVQSRFEAAQSWSQQAFELARQTGSRDVSARALGYRGVARVALGDSAGFTDLESAVEIAEEIDHGENLTVAASNLAVVLIRSCRPLEAEPYLDIAHRAASRHSLDAALFRIETLRCHVLMLRGEWTDAQQRLRTQVAAGDDPGVNLANPLALLGRILARRGDPQAAALIDRAWAIASATGEDQKMAVAGAARIEQAWLSGDEAAVQGIGAELLELAERTAHLYLWGEVLRYLRRTGLPVEPVPRIPPAFTAGIAGRWQEAARLWQQAGNPYQQALELTESPNVSTVARGLRILDGLGAAAAASVVRRLLRTQGVRGLPRGPRATTKANPGRLTDRQVEVVALLAEGCTNGEIAARLYVSRRTVDNHVAAVLNRLGTASRRDAVAIASSLGLVPAPRRET